MHPTKVTAKKNILIRPQRGSSGTYMDCCRPLYCCCSTNRWLLKKLKKAVVRPPLKKHGLDAIQMKNYRPLSNLPFLSKVLERSVQSRLQTFLDGNGLMPKTQSAYRHYHSTETVLTMVYNDMLMAADGGQVSALCLLDLSAAFDTVDHNLLMWSLEHQYGLRAHTSVAELSKSSREAVRHQPSTSHVPYDKAQCSVNISLYCKRRTFKPLRGTWHQFPRVCRRHAAICTLSSR